MAQAQGTRKQTIINGRRIKTIDIHAHYAIAEAIALTGRNPMKGLPQSRRGAGEAISVVEQRLRAMDSQGIDIEAPSINQWW